MIEGIHFVRSARAGKPIRWYVYAWRGGPCILKSEGAKKPKLGKAEIAAINAALDDAKAVKLDTMAGLIRTCRANPVDPDRWSPEWKALAPSTRGLWEPELVAIELKWGETPLRLWNDPRMIQKVIAWRDSRCATPRAADQGITVLNWLLNFGMLRALVGVNVAASVPAIYRPEGREEIIWTPDNIDCFMVAAIALNRPHAIDALWLACLTGFRRADLIAVTFDQVGEHAIARTAQKKSKGRRRRAVVPLIPATRELLAELRTRHRLPGVETLLVNSEGRPWTGGSLTHAINEVRDYAGIVEPANAELNLPARKKHLHDCRGTFVTHLCRQRLTDREIANITAWSEQNVAAIRRRYVDDAAVIVALGQRIASGSV